MPRAQVGYLNAEWKHRSERPRILSGETRRANTSLHDVEVRDARPLHRDGTLGLDTNGFILAEHQSEVTDFSDAEQVRQVYAAEMSELLQGLTGADEVFLFPFAPLRNEAPDHFLGAYSLYMHCDYAERTRDRMTRALLRRCGSPLAETAEGWEFAWYNLWRPVDWEVQSQPLTIVDAETVDSDDVVEYHPAEGSIASLPVFNEQQRLYYFPGMQTNEVAIFKQLDSRPDHARTCPHTSFADPDSPPDALPRRSLELRLMCAFSP